jgi:hypothetical protein
MHDMPKPEFGYLEGAPVRYTATEAWAFVDGKWEEFHPAEAYHKARVVGEAAFKALFPNLPDLPNSAFQHPIERI